MKSASVSAQKYQNLFKKVLKKENANDSDIGRYIKVFHENTSLKKEMAQPALQVFGGWFEGIWKNFWFWQVLGGAQAISGFIIFTL